jgi:DNA-nicking Smr family endonuclease
MQDNAPAGHDSPAFQKERSMKPPPAGSEQSDRARGAVERQNPITNRHGLPLLSDRDDLQHHFEASAASDLDDADRASADQPRQTDGCGRKDKNGIPVLDHCRDLGRLMASTGDEEAPDEEWSQAFQASISHDAGTLMKRKTGGIYPVRSLTLKERLQRYPRPQGQLDLHGATAIKAQERTDAYVRTAHADGLFTLRIIVGKGLHSESGAVLPDVVEDRLIQLKRDGLVLAYRWEKGVKRKSGAVIVYLETPI